MTKTLKYLDDYIIINTNDEIGFQYTVEELLQPSFHSCWAITTAVLLKFAGILDKDIKNVPNYRDIFNVEHDYSKPIEHFKYVSSLMKVFFTYLKKSLKERKSSTKDYEDLYKIKYILDSNTNQFRPYAMNQPPINPLDSVDEVAKNSFMQDSTGLFQLYQDLVSYGEFGRFQDYQAFYSEWHMPVMYNYLVRELQRVENDRRSGFRLESGSRYEILRSRFSDNPYATIPGGLNITDNYIRNVLSVRTNQNDVRSACQNFDSAVVEWNDYDNFFINFCGLDFSSAVDLTNDIDSKYFLSDDQTTEQNTTSDFKIYKKLCLYFADELLTYGPLLINYNPNDINNLSSHWVILCGMTINPLSKLFSFIVMDPWKVVENPWNSGKKGMIRKQDANFFFNGFLTLYEKYIQLSNQNIIRTIPTQIFHLPENKISVPERSEIIIHLAQ